ncbi:MAG TPA: sugar phosphate nucleotidyltransferase [Steroidobacteraceae bacterium]|nr:sugar phosphate nucleotidyltransferase [Steroidobacteraceae bacterium]
MIEESHAWAVILAAGEGSRLQALTTLPSGIAIPKQFCSLYEGPSLLEEALRRGESVADRSHICAVVAEQHRCWWEGALTSLPDRNVIVQPENRGTANGILLPLMHILLRDPCARIVLLPADHHVLQEAVLTASLRDALEQLDSRSGETLLLGIQPGEVDPDLGYILPGETDGRGTLTVARFIEKPSHAVAAELIRAGGLWNAFIVVTTAGALLELFRQRIPQVVEAMRAAVRGDREQGSSIAAVAELYRRLPTIDFSRDIVAGQESRLRVLPVRPCGWSDLGTPKRVAEVLRRARHAKATPPGRPAVPAHVSLAAQHERMQVGGYCNRTAAAQ